MQPRILILALALPVLAGLGACQTPPPPTPTGAEDYASFCADCHGATGLGDGPLAAGLTPRPANLTRLSTGKPAAFPMAPVMSKIWGYAETSPAAGAGMPAFAPLLEGETVLVDTGDGIATPTPLRLVQLAEHLKGLQTRP